MMPAYRAGSHNRRRAHADFHPAPSYEPEAPARDGEAPRSRFGFVLCRGHRPTRSASEGRRSPSLALRVRVLLRAQAGATSIVWGPRLEPRRFPSDAAILTRSASEGGGSPSLALRVRAVPRTHANRKRKRGMGKPLTRFGFLLCCAHTSVPPMADPRRPRTSSEPRSMCGRGSKQEGAGSPVMTSTKIKVPATASKRMPPGPRTGASPARRGRRRSPVRRPTHPSGHSRA